MCRQPLILLRSVKKCHQRGQITQEPEFYCCWFLSSWSHWWLVVSLSFPRWSSDLWTESRTGERKVRQVWCCLQANPLLSSHFSLPFTSDHLFFSPDLGHQGQVQLHKTAHMSLKPRVSEMERSGKLKEWEQMNRLWIVNLAFESAVCFAWIPCGAE